MYQKEVHYRGGWARGESVQTECRVPNQSIEGGRQPTQASTGEAGQGRRPGMNEGMFGVNRERLKYKWVNCMDLE